MTYNLTFAIAAILIYCSNDQRKNFYKQLKKKGYKMSAFLLNNQRLFNIAGNLVNRKDFGNVYFKMRLQKVFNEDIELSQEKSNKQIYSLFEILLNFNASSVAFRYQHRDDIDLDDMLKVAMIRGVKSEFEHYTDIQLFKSLQCFVYQACECKEIEEDKFFIAIKSFIPWLAEHILSNTEEYNASQWG